MVEKNGVIQWMIIVEYVIHIGKKEAWKKPRFQTHLIVSVPTGWCPPVMFVGL